jgi:hypothetical protein
MALPSWCTSGGQRQHVSTHRAGWLRQELVLPFCTQMQQGCQNSIRPPATVDALQARTLPPSSLDRPGPGGAACHLRHASSCAEPAAGAHCSGAVWAESAQLKVGRKRQNAAYWYFVGCSCRIGARGGPAPAERMRLAPPGYMCWVAVMMLTLHLIVDMPPAWYAAVHPQQPS